MPKSQNTHTTTYILDGNIKSLCRVCLTQSPKMFKLTDNLNTDEYAIETYVEALEKVTSVKVKLDIDYPLGICPMCISLLKITLQFVTQFVKSQEKIHDMLGEDEQDYENIKLEIHTDDDDDFDEEREQECENESDEDTNVEIISLNVEDPVSKNDFNEENENENIVVNDEVSILDVRNCDESDETSEYQLNKIDSDGNDNVEYIVENIEQLENDVYSRESDAKTGGLNSSIENLVDHANGDCDVDSNKSETLSHIEYIEIINNDTDKDTRCKLSESDHEKSVPRRRGRKRKRKVDDEIKDDLVKQMKFPCEVCKKVYQSKLSLKSHQNRVHREHLFKVFRCDLCGENCRTSSALTNHKLKHFEKQFKCGVCDKAYTTKAHLKVHIAAHENNRPFLCNVCGKGFNYANALSYHMRLHTGEKNYHCEYCPKTFRMVNSLNRHLRTHTGEKPYKCQYCGRDFSSRGEVVCHEYIHTGYRPYHCKYCKKGFSKTHNLKIHLLSHNGPYQCWFCTKSFIEENILAMHLKISHKSRLSEEEQHEGTTTTDFDDDSQEANEYMDFNIKEEVDEELE